MVTHTLVSIQDMALNIRVEDLNKRYLQEKTLQTLFNSLSVKHTLESSLNNCHAL